MNQMNFMNYNHINDQINNNNLSKPLNIIFRLESIKLVIQCKSDEKNKINYK